MISPPIPSNKFGGPNTGFDERMVTEWAHALPKGKLEELSKLINRVKHTRYNKGRYATPKYGNLNLAWSKDKVSRFLKIIDNRRDRLMFLLQLCLGLRAQEVVNLKSEDLVKLPTTYYDEATLKEKWSKTLPWMRINPLKQHTPTYDFSPVPSFLAEELGFYVEVERCEWLFPSRMQAGKQANAALVADRFRLYCRKAGFETVYSYADDENNPKHRKDGNSRRLFLEKATASAGTLTEPSWNQQSYTIGKSQS